MAIVTDSWILDVWILLIILICAVYYILTYNFNHFKILGIPYVRPVPLFGNIKDAMLKKISLTENFSILYDEIKVHKYGGIFLGTVPMLLVCDPDLIKSITIKDFDHFSDRRELMSESVEPMLAKTLFNLRGQRWRDMRAQLTPTFTTGKMKKMFTLMCENGEKLAVYFGDYAKDNKDLEMKDTLARFTTDVIGSCAFGVECNALKYPDAEFHTMGKKLMDMKGLRFILIMAIILFPKFSQLLGITFIPKDVKSFFRSAVMGTIEYRDKNMVKRPDFLQMMMQLRKGKLMDDDLDDTEQEKKAIQEKGIPTKMGLSDMDILAQALFFFVGGFDTSATLMSFMSYELAVNTDIQEHLRKEIMSVISKNGGNLTYEAIQEMEYLDRVVNETLRKYPPIIVLDRIVTKKYLIPGTSISLEPGEIVEIPVYALHHDPKYYPEPQRFDPDRFIESVQNERPATTFLPFGVGPRHCIGLRFAQMQVKVGMCYTLQRYEIVPGPKTVIPIRLDRENFNLSSEGGIWLRMKNL